MLALCLVAFTLHHINRELSLQPHFKIMTWFELVPQFCRKDVDGLRMELNFYSIYLQQGVTV